MGVTSEEGTRPPAYQTFVKEIHIYCLSNIYTVTAMRLASHSIATVTLTNADHSVHSLSNKNTRNNKSVLFPPVFLKSAKRRNNTDVRIQFSCRSPIILAQL